MGAKLLSRGAFGEISSRRGSVAARLFLRPPKISQYAITELYGGITAQWPVCIDRTGGNMLRLKARMTYIFGRRLSDYVATLASN